MTTTTTTTRAGRKTTNRAIVVLVSLCTIFVVVSLVIQTKSMNQESHSIEQLSAPPRTLQHRMTNNATQQQAAAVREQELQELNRTVWSLRLQLEQAKQQPQQFLLSENNSTLNNNHTLQHEELQKLNAQLLDELYRSYSNYLIHTPKTGGESLIKILNTDRRELSVVRQEGLRWNNRVCNHAVANVEKWWHNWMTQERCWLHASEFPYSSLPDHVFGMVRDPIHHVASMYFHCTESTHHENRAEYMPTTLLEWLEEWTHVMPTMTKNKAVQMRKQFKCYNPINLQSKFLKYTPNQTVLEERFHVVGLTSEMVKTSCLISIAIHAKVPRRCNCTTEKKQQHHHKKHKRVDHGVTHHGDTVELTSAELQAIQTLTQTDVILYQQAERLFWDKVDFVEQEYSITLC